MILANAVDVGSFEFWIICGAAFVTSVLSAILGMAGGIILLTVMLFYFDPVVAIAIHGVIQLLSNAARATIQRAHVKWSLTWRYAILLLPMGYLGACVAMELPPHFTKLLIGVFVLLATWRPRWLLLGANPESVRPGPRFVALGGFIGFASIIVGATGPLQAPFFLNLGLTRQEIVGTKAACQTLGHLSKTLILGAAGFVFTPYVTQIGIMSLCVLTGTWIGSRLLDRVNDDLFTLLFKSALSLIALQFIVWDGWRVVQSVWNSGG